MLYIYIYKINNVDASIIIAWWLNKFGLGDVTSQAALEFLWRERERGKGDNNFRIHHMQWIL